MRHIMFKNSEEGSGSHLVKWPLYDTSIYVSPCHLVIPPQKSIMVHFNGRHVIHTLEPDRNPMIMGQESQDLCMWVINTSHLQPVVVPEGKPLDCVIDDSFWVLAYFSMVPRCQRIQLLYDMLNITDDDNPSGGGGPREGVDTLVTMMSKNLVL